MKQQVKTSILLVFFFSLITQHSSLNTLFAQAPQKFNYQAVARNGNAILENASLDVKLEILQGSTTGTMVWTETQTDVTTNDYGLFSIQAGSENEISIDWNDGPYFLKVQVDIGTGFQDFGNSELLSVPYALNTQSVSSLEKLDILGPADMDPDSALFEVKRNDGQTIFAVYNSGVRMFVEEGESKGRRGGFAIGGFTPGKGETGEYFRVTPDSVRIYLDTTTAKRPKGGFAIGGFTPGKDGDEDGDHYFNVFTQSEAGVINPSQPRILWYPKKEAFLTGRVLIESPDSVGTNSLATGFESKSIGDYSQALGYKARAKGNNSTAIGNNANAAGIASYAFGNYAMAQDSGSYAIGSGATASGLRSFALGSTGLDLAGIAITPTMAIGNYAYAFGMGSVASGQGAFALGTKNSAIGDYSIAMGYNTQAIGGYSAAIGLNAIASGGVSLSIGNSTTASAGSSTALGFRTTASGDISTATGYNTTASGDYSTAMGTSNEASGMMSTAMGAGTIAKARWSTSMGRSTIANSESSFIIGQYNDTLPTCAPVGSCSSDALFIIGNGTSFSRHNAVVVKRSGEVYLPNVYTYFVGATNRDMFIDNTGKIGYVSSSLRYKKNIDNMEDISWLYQLHPVNFSYKTDNSETKQYGLIAEEVEEVNSSFVSYNENGEVETVSYSQLITPMLKALQEQKNEISSLKQEINKLKSEQSELALLKEQVRLLQESLGLVGSINDD